MAESSGISFRDGVTLSWPTHIQSHGFAKWRAGRKSLTYPGIWRDINITMVSGAPHLEATIKQPADNRSMRSAIKQTGTIQVVMNVDAAFRQFGLDLGQRLEYVLPSGFKISLDPVRQTLVWPGRRGVYRSSPVANQFLNGWLAAYSPSPLIFSLRYHQVDASGILDLARIYGTQEVVHHIDAALIQFGIL